MGSVTTEKEQEQQLNSSPSYTGSCENVEFFKELFARIGKNQNEIPYIQVLLNNLNLLASELEPISSLDFNSNNVSINNEKGTRAGINELMKLVEDQEESPIYYVTQLYNLLLLNVIDGHVKKSSSQGYSTRYGLWNFNIDFPVISLTLLQEPFSKDKLKSILGNELLWRLGSLYQHEYEFKRNFDKDNVADLTNKKWTILIELLSKQMGNNFIYPTTQTDAINLYSEYDTYDLYIRVHREPELKKLKKEAEALESGDTLKATLEFCLDYFETHFKHKSVTCKYINFDDILDPHPEHEKGNQWVKDWLPTCFLDPAVVQYYLKDTLLFDCCNYIYSFLPDIRLISELGKITVVAVYLDDFAESDNAFVAIWVDAIDFELRGASLEELEAWAHPRCNDIENAALRGFIIACRNINILGHCDISSAWKQFVLNVKVIHTQEFKSCEEYFAARLIDIGVNPYNVVVSANYGHTTADIPWEINYPMLNYCGIENDLYSLGQESKIQSNVSLEANSVTLFRKFHPEMSTQDVVFMLEAIRDKHWDESVSKWKGTDKDHWWRICVAIGYTTLVAIRYSRGFILRAKSTVLIHCH